MSTHQQSEAYAMTANLKIAIDKWINKSSYNDNSGFEKELAILYRSLVGAAQVTNDTRIEEFLNSDEAFMDRCVQWHLLKLAIQGAQDSIRTETSLLPLCNPHVQLAKMIMASKEAGWELLLLLPTGKKLRKSCKWNQGNENWEMKNRKARLQQNPHLRIKQTDRQEKTLFATALCEGNPYMEALLAEARELYSRQLRTEAEKSDPKKQSENYFVTRVRNNKTGPTILHNDIVTAHKTAPLALGPVLHRLPGILLPGDDQESDKRLLDRIIEDHLLELAEVILQSERHRGLLTTRERIVKAIELCGGRGNDDDKTNRRDLVISLLSNASEDVLRSPEVLTVVMKNNLLNDHDVLKSYARNAKDDSKTFPVPFASLKPVAWFLRNVYGILHMAVFYQQQPLVEALLRCNAGLATTRAYVEATTAGDTFPLRIRKEASAETTVAAVDAATAVDPVLHSQQGDDGYYPLWYNNEAKTTKIATTSAESQHVQDEDSLVATKQRNPAWEQIRSALIYCTMKHAENMQTLLAVLRESRENEINFDMSRLLIEGTSVADFVTSLTRDEKSYNLIRYEETIRYAQFPVLDLGTQSQTVAAQNLQRSYLQRAHREILDMLDWLAKHGVRRIITLRVPDRMAHPHDELEISQAVRRFRVEELDWRILDLSLNIFQPHGEPESIPFVCTIDSDKTKDNKACKNGGKNGKMNKIVKAMEDRNEREDKTSGETSVQNTYLRRLHLYTGGRRSALDHWFSTEGLETTKLDHVSIHVIKELATKEQSNATLRYINRKVEELRKRKSSMKIDVQSQFWTIETETPRLQKIIHHLSPRLAKFIANYCQRASSIHDGRKRFRPAKVAIIDNGILSMEPPSATRVASPTRPEAPADSFVYERDSWSPWYLASNPHGTQMANLVCAIDPLCQLFIAKIADSHYGSSAARAAKAPFNEAVQKAMGAGILVVCSHHDEGARIGTKAFPACLSSVGEHHTMLRMASCNMYGKLQHDWDDYTVDAASKKENQYDFYINSQDIRVGTIPFLATSTERVSGSSVSTAIAAGVCSLLIACLRTLDEMTSVVKADPTTKEGRAILHMQENVRRALATDDRPSYAAIKNYLSTMAPSTTNPRFITLDRFARLDELRDDTSSGFFQKLLDLVANFKV
ncbi:hypothetical protein ACQRIU_007056 [Beauveria bassiana]